MVNSTSMATKRRSSKVLGTREELCNEAPLQVEGIAQCGRLERIVRLESDTSDKEERLQLIPKLHLQVKVIVVHPIEGTPRVYLAVAGVWVQMILMLEAKCIETKLKHLNRKKMPTILRDEMWFLCCTLKLQMLKVRKKTFRS